MKSFELWSEGYVVTGGNQPALYLGNWMGNTFEEACCNWVQSLSAKDQSFFNKEHLTFWGCQLYDNEQDARKFNG